MPLSARNRWLTFLLLVALALLAVAGSVSVFYQGERISELEQRIVQTCIILAGMVAALARQEYVTRKAKHDLANGQQVITLEVAKAAQELPQAVVNKFNGGLDKAAAKAVEQKLDASPFPTTPEQLRQFIRDCQAENCEAVALTAARQAVREVEERGWTPPPDRRMQL